MSFASKLFRVRSVFALLLALAFSPNSMSAGTESSSIGNIVVPIPLAPDNVQSCVEPTDVMRRDHMKFLLHQRDQTVYEGDRAKKYSLAECINCHAQAKAGAEIVRIDNPDHFCAGCHIFAGVDIDCFECHSDRPPVDMAYRHKFRLDDRRLATRFELSRVDETLSDDLLELLNRQVGYRDD